MFNLVNIHTSMWRKEHILICWQIIFVKSRTLFIPACWSLYYILYQQAVTHARSASEDSFSTVISSIFQYYYVLSVSISHDCTAALQTLSSLAKYTPTCSHLIFSLVLRIVSAWSETWLPFPRTWKSKQFASRHPWGSRLISRLVAPGQRDLAR